MDCEQAETRTAHAQLLSGRHDNAKGTVTTPERVQQAGGEALHCKRYACAVDAAATVYKQVQRLNKSPQTQALHVPAPQNSNRDETAQ